jgi:hypothetical protein
MPRHSPANPTQNRAALCYQNSPHTEYPPPDAYLQRQQLTAVILATTMHIKCDFLPQRRSLVVGGHVKPGVRAVRAPTLGAARPPGGAAVALI